MCDAVIKVLRNLDIPDDREETELPGIQRNQIPNFYFFLVGICHQTSPQGPPPIEGVVDGRLRTGWDFLWARFAAECSKNPNRLLPDVWANETESSLIDTFTDPVRGFRLTDPAGRAALIRDLGIRLLDRGVESIQALYESCGGRIATGHPNLLEGLREFEAYSDPVDKKAIFFLSLMRNSGIWKFIDDAALEAPVDYHEVRGHLRIGTVRVVDHALAEKIRSGSKVQSREHVAIRLATREAIRSISRGHFHR